METACLALTVLKVDLYWTLKIWKGPRSNYEKLLSCGFKVWLYFWKFFLLKISFPNVGYYPNLQLWIQKEWIFNTMKFHWSNQVSTKLLFPVSGCSKRDFVEFSFNWWKYFLKMSYKWLLLAEKLLR